MQRSLLPVLGVFLLFSPAPACDLLVAAASDLSSLQEPLASAVPGCRVRFVFGSSGMLARQIAQGAPYDVFLSADEHRVRELSDQHALDPDILIYAVGRLAMWSKSLRLTRLAELTGPAVRHVALANPAHAPYGLAARQALERAGLWNQLKEKLVMGENVRQALEYASSGNADVALTAWSLVSRRGGVLVPSDLHEPIRQSGGVVRSSRQKETARRFLAFLTSDRGRRLLRENGLWP
ncbi:MAG: molybdate ABC transporter substrate-binding protein [Bryobacteraceae bacterium]